MELSRLVCGTNAFCGISHFTPSRDMFLAEYFTLERVIEIMTFVLEEFGVNCIVSSPRDNIARAIDAIEKETGTRYAWLCTPSARDTAKGAGQSLAEQVRWCADHHVAACLPHRSWTDAYMNTARMEIEGLEEVTAQVRDLGMIPGLSTHYYEAISICEQRKYDIPLIIQPLNVLGFQSNIEVNTLARKIKSTRIAILAIKPMAAGRVEPETGLEFAFRNVKDGDLVAAGFSCLQDADYDCQLVERLLA